ncbi:MAG: hypothetical protein ABIK33_00095 [candidate division WOR-3 bacterium]
MIKIKIDNQERYIESKEHLIKEIQEGKISPVAQIQSEEIFGDPFWRTIGKTSIFEDNRKYELTSEEKKKIYDEEKTRFEIQKKLKEQDEAKKTQNALIGCVSLIIIAIIIVFVSGMFKSDKTADKSSSYIPKQKADIFILDSKSEYRYGYLTVTGSVKNRSKNITAYGVKVLTTVYDTNEQTKLAEDWNYIAGYNLGPNEQAAFELIIRVPGEPTRIRYSLKTDYE